MFYHCICESLDLLQLTLGGRTGVSLLAFSLIFFKDLHNESGVLSNTLHICWCKKMWSNSVLLDFLFSVLLMSHYPTGNSIFRTRPLMRSCYLHVHR